KAIRSCARSNPLNASRTTLFLLSTLHAPPTTALSGDAKGPPLDRHAGRGRFFQRLADPRSRLPRDRPSPFLQVRVLLRVRKSPAPRERRCRATHFYDASCATTSH